MDDKGRSFFGAGEAPARTSPEKMPGRSAPEKKRERGDVMWTIGRLGLENCGNGRLDGVRGVEGGGLPPLDVYPPT